MGEILIGIVSGIVSGTGMGGGTILIFLLTFMLGIEQHTAQATNLIFFIPTSIVAIIVNLKNKNIDLKILRENIEILYDLELAQKIDKLLALGKEARDISLMPNVLVKYDLKGLNNTINVLQISGLDPKKVPLMAY